MTTTTNENIIKLTDGANWVIISTYRRGPTILTNSAGEGGKISRSEGHARIARLLASGWIVA